MDSAPKPSWFSRFVSSLSWLLPASTLNNFNQSSNAGQQNHPQIVEPESSISVYNSENQEDSQDQLHVSTMSDFEPGNPILDTPNPKLEVELSAFPQPDMETQDDLGFTYSIPSYPPLYLTVFDSASSTLPETFSRFQEDENGAEAESALLSPTASTDRPMPVPYQVQTTTPLDLHCSPTHELASSSFDSFSTRSSSRDGLNISPPQPSTIATTTQSPNAKNPTLVGVHRSRPQPLIATKQNPNPNISTKVGNSQSNEVEVLISSTAAAAAHPVLQIIDAQELGKQVLVLAIPMVLGLVATSNPLAKSVEMQVVSVALCCAFAAIWNGILLRKSYQTASTVLLVGGIALMMLAFYSFVGCFLPLGLKWIPGLCWLASLFPPAKVLLALFRRKKVAGEEDDIEKGNED